ncbi:GGDEF domain-containing protein [Acinetobacter sp.]|uniref:GGDEF domain-containing protein n=1 Tax=Acinetobacter sp. TaxID=472 RepID=UPI0031E1F7A9
MIIPILCTSLAIFEILLQQQHLQEQLIYKLSYLDPLTNIANRRTINTCLQQLNQSELADYSIILLDLDHFKEVNDRYGHHTGDQVLIHVAKILKEHTQPYDLVGRFGGEEFILILKDTSLAVAKETAMQCKNAIEHMHMYSQDTQQYFFITASLGVAMAEGDLPPQQILSQADQALYQAKFSGRNQVKVFQSDL